MRIDDETLAAGRCIVSEFLDDAIGFGLRRREILSVTLSCRGDLTVSARRWDMEKWPTRSGENLRVHTPQHFLIAAGKISASETKEVWKHFGPTRQRMIVTIVRELLAAKGGSTDFPAFGQAFRTINGGAQALIPLSAATRGRPLLVSFLDDQTAEIVPLTYRLRLNRTTGRAMIVPVVGREKTTSVHRFDLEALARLSPTRQFDECRDEFLNKINLLLDDPFVCQGDPLLTPAADALDVSVTRAIEAVVGDLVAANGPHAEAPLTIAYQVQFPRYDVVLLAHPAVLAALADEIRSAIRDVVIAAAAPPVGTYTFYGQSLNLTRLSEWSLAVRPPNLTYAHASAHERMLARRRLALTMAPRSPMPDSPP
jgi:hypothetical protein